VNYGKTRFIALNTCFKCLEISNIVILKQEQGQRGLDIESTLKIRIKNKLQNIWKVK
jgi:hypothetical protein